MCNPHPLTLGSPDTSYDSIAPETSFDTMDLDTVQWEEIVEVSLRLDLAP